MLFRRFYDDALAQASYLVGCQATGEAVVVDPHRDADLYVRAAAEEGVRITHVTETHIHADYLSGSRELAARTGARLFLSSGGGPDWSYRFADADGARLLDDGEVVEVGNVRLTALHTPGHTPEHVSFLVTDGATTSEPLGLLSGDFLFVGDVGRPDLLEKAAGVVGTMDGAARDLFRSLRRLDTLPDHLQVWPGHGAGSACGKALGAMPSSTLGYERLVNPALGHTDEAGFVAWVLDDQPEPPRYFAVMKRLNRDGPPVVGHLPEPGRVGGDRVQALLADGAVGLDLRPREAFAAGHLPGTLNLPLNRSFTNWAGSLLPYDAPLVFLGVEQAAARAAARALFFIGLDRVVGFAGPELFDEEHLVADLEEAESVSPTEAAERLERGALLLDVRGAGEWRGGHAAGAHHLHLGRLPDALGEVPHDGMVLVMCQTGARSAIARSLLQARGRRAVNVEGGVEAWARAGLPMERGG